MSTFAIVDFGAIERWKPGAIPTLLRPVLRGRKPVWVDFRFQAKDGIGRIIARVDPLKDIKSQIMAVRASLKSRAEAVLSRATMSKRSMLGRNGGAAK